MHHLRMLVARSLEQLLIARPWIAAPVYGIRIYITDIGHLYIIWQLTILHLHLHLHLLLHLHLVHLILGRLRRHVRKIEIVMNLRRLVRVHILILLLLLLLLSFGALTLQDAIHPLDEVGRLCYCRTSLVRNCL